jgi:hypothetical protein
MMGMTLPLRMVLDTIAACLLLAGLAYYWVDNTTHELIGTGMFLLVAVHNVFNRRWYGNISRHRRQGSGLMNIVTTAILLTTMLVLLVSSVLVSRTVFGFLGYEGGPTARQVHLVAAHWAVLVVGIHLGMRWSLVMQTVRTRLGLAQHNRLCTVVLRVLAAAIALHGVQSSTTMVFGSKLFLIDVMDMWDFNAEAMRFFLNFASIMGLYIALGHYVSAWLRGRAQRVPAPAQASR